MPSMSATEATPTGRREDTEFADKCLYYMVLMREVEDRIERKMARRGSLLQGRTRQHRVAMVDGPPEWLGTYRTVRFTGTTGATFSAVPVDAGREAVGV